MSDQTPDNTSADAPPEPVNDVDIEPTTAELLALLERLRKEHRRVDTEIEALVENGATDMLKIKRMKKIKLSMKDQIVYIENQLTPDIIA